MSIVDGQAADAATVNAAFVSKSADSEMTGILGLANTADPDSGDAIDNVQQGLNELLESSGQVGLGDASKDAYSSNEYIDDGDSRKVALGKLDAALKVVEDAISKTISGSRASPNAIVAGDGVGVAGARDETQYIEGSGGAVTVSANPQIASGATDGDRLLLVGRSDTNTVTLANGTGLSLNGDIVLGEDDALLLNWDGTNWSEISRRR